MENNKQPPYLPKPVSPNQFSPFNLFQPENTVFGENITYIEYLMSVLKTLNQCIAYLNYLNDNYTGWDKQIKEIQDQVNALSERITKEIILLEQKIKDGDNNAISVSKTYIDQEIIKVNKRIDNITSTLNPIYDPTTGLVSPVQTVVINVYESCRCGALTAEEYDNLELTAIEFTDKDVNAHNYDINGKRYFLNS